MAMSSTPTRETRRARREASAVARLADDPRLVGVAAGGSYAGDALDEFSDLDLVLGALLVAFTGEHVGEPRLLIWLYGPPLLHVDLEFVRVADVGERVEDPIVLWERDGRLRAGLATGVGRYPVPDPQVIEDRFWVLAHYVATKIGRGELLEAVDALSFVRGMALGPLALASRGARPTSVRKLEQIAPDLAAEIAATIGACEPRALVAALEGTATVYRKLRAATTSAELQRRTAAEAAAVDYVRTIAARVEA